MKQHRTIYILATVLACTLAGCLFPLTTYRYDLGTDTARTPTRLARNVVIAFESFEVDNAYDREQFMVRAPDGELWAVEMYRWVEAPSAIITSFAMTCADRAFSNDQVTSDLTGADYVVRARVLEFVINVDDANVPLSAEVRIDYTVVRGPYSRTPKNVLSRVIAKTVDVIGYRHENVAVAMGAAVDLSIVELMGAIANDAKSPVPPQGITMLTTGDDGTGTDVVMRRDSTGAISHVQLERGHHGYRQGTVATTRIDGYNAAFTFKSPIVPGDDTTPLDGSLRMHDGIYVMRLRSPRDVVHEYRVFSPSTSAIATWVRSLDPTVVDVEVVGRDN